jgi:hypothetical protein
MAWSRIQRPGISTGIVCLLVSVASAAPAPPKKQPMTRLECAAGERVIVEVRPTESPFINVRKTDWAGFFGQLTTGFAMGGVGGLAAGMSQPPISQDVSGKFAPGVRAALERVSVDQLIAKSTERAMKDRVSCELVFMTSDERKAAELRPTDRFVMVGLYLEYSGGDPTMTARFGAIQVAKSADLALIDQGAAQLKAMEAEVANPGKRPSLGRLKEYQKLAEQLMTLAQGAWSDVYKSPSHKVDEWLADDGRLVSVELTAGLERLIGSLAGTLSP